MPALFVCRGWGNDELQVGHRRSRSNQPAFHQGLETAHLCWVAGRAYTFGRSLRLAAWWGHAYNAPGHAASLVTTPQHAYTPKLHTAYPSAHAHPSITMHHPSCSCNPPLASPLLQSYTSEPANVRLEGGSLLITALKAPDGTFTSGRINTKASAAFVPGMVGPGGSTCATIRVEARLRHTAPGQGLWGAFWMFPRDLKYGPWPASGE
jgi:hypothetical protein